jgi:Na+:H+ antiporter, NhaA family
MSGPGRNQAVTRPDPHLPHHAAGRASRTLSSEVGAPGSLVGSYIAMTDRRLIPLTAPKRRQTVFLGRIPLPERNFVAEALRTETVGGLLLLVAAVAALLWVNSPLDASYDAAVGFHFGPSALNLHLSVAHWASDGLLTIFFFVAGIELKRELVAGELKSPSAAALPVVAALCGMAVPALVYCLVNVAGDVSFQGWAVPTATDIAFALAVLAVISTSLPSVLRAFLLTLAVVDDLVAIVIIAVYPWRLSTGPSRTPAGCTPPSRASPWA